MSQNKVTKRDIRKSVESVTRNTDPLHAYTSTYVESNKSRFQLQAEIQTETMSSMITEVEQTVSFVDNSVGDVETTPTNYNPIAMIDGTEDVSLGKFLGRPVTIDNYNWTTSDPVGLLRTIKPWHLFLNNAAVLRKINNYAFMRGKLHVKFMINATPFQYGLTRICYSPLLGFISDKIRAGPAGSNPDFSLAPYSQQPGVYLHPQNNAGGEMELPFFYFKNWLDITSTADVQNFGTLQFVVFSPLQLAVTGASTSITIRTMAWMTDVELMGPTSRLALQADEYGNGSISAPASALASIASNLTHVPVIGKFARVTQIGASAVSSIASIFGFTNVPNINNVEPVYIMSAPHLATSDISVPTQKLSLDPKTELSIDPSLFDLPPQDELSISYLKKKESYICQSLWSNSDIVGTNLLSVRVNPLLHKNENLVSTPFVLGQRVNTTPLGYIAQLFQNWRGSLKFRFKIIATKYHKGRLKISFDPRENISNVEPDSNTCYTHILDIGEKDDVTIEIPYHQALAWLSTPDLLYSTGGYQTNLYGGTPTSLAPVLGVDNGMFTIRVFNALESPISAPVYINVYISAGDSFEYANPSGSVGFTGYPAPPSFFALQSDTTDISTSHITMGTKTQSHEHRYAQNFGENIGSLRKLLHRSQVVDTVTFPNGTPGNIVGIKKVLQRMPYTPGFQPFLTLANKRFSAGTSNYSFNNMHMMPYIASMFLGYRGSVNYTITTNNQRDVNDVRVCRTTDALATTTNRYILKAYDFPVSSTFSTGSFNLNQGLNKYDGLAGYALTSTNASPSVQVTIPDYNNYNFGLADPNNYMLGSALDGTDVQSTIISLNMNNQADTDISRYTSLSVSAAAGADFTCLYFLCCPTLDFSNGAYTPV